MTTSSELLELLDYIADTCEALESRLTRVETRICKIADHFGIPNVGAPTRPTRPTRPAANTNPTQP